MKFDVSGFVSGNGSLQVRFRSPSDWTPYFSGYSTTLQYGRLTFGIGKDSENQFLSDQISYSLSSDVNGTWDTYIIGDTLSAVAPNGQLYTTNVKPYFASTSAQDRVPGSGLTFGIAGSAEAKNFKVYEVGV
ncbi:hypothetical protein [Sinomonas humi]|uniref:Uncharacterized protein n=1 Tax=Sinomonas humi TaxID=1338436 RepID=A0A0B2AJI3_9MICC|nr:hypothetical protein [Sinomonas humi]KHL01922.1 hypothetical protein LK10_14265 [Sinomonas humi]